MTVEIPPDLQQFVHQVVDAGSYKSEAEVVGQRCGCCRNNSGASRSLRREIQPALDRLDRGEGIELDDEGLDAFFEDVKAQSQAELTAERES